MLVWNGKSLKMSARGPLTWKLILCVYMELDEEQETMKRIDYSFVYEYCLLKTFDLSPFFLPLMLYMFGDCSWTY